MTVTQCQGIRTAKQIQVFIEQMVWWQSVEDNYSGEMLSHKNVSNDAGFALMKDWYGSPFRTGSCLKYSWFLSIWNTRIKSLLIFLFSWDKSRWWFLKQESQTLHQSGHQYLETRIQCGRSCLGYGWPAWIQHPKRCRTRAQYRRKRLKMTARRKIFSLGENVLVIC